MVCVNNAGSGRSVDRGERGDTCASPSTLQVLLIQSFSHLDSPISARRVSERRHQMGLEKGEGEAVTTLRPLLAGQRWSAVG